MNNEKKIRHIINQEIPAFKLLVVFSFILSMIIKVTGLIPGLLMQKIVDVWIPEGNVKKCILYIILFVLIPTLLTVGNAIYQYVVIVNGRNMSKKLSTRGFEKQVYQPLSYFDQNKSAELASYCRSESTKYILFWLMDIPQMISNVVCGLIILSYISINNIFFGIAILLYIPLLLLPNKFFAKIIEKLSEKIIKNNSIVHQIIGDTFKAIKHVKSFVLEKIMIKKVYDVTTDTAETFAKCAAVENIYGTWANSFVDNLFTGVLFSIGAICVINNKLTIGILIIILNYLPIFWSAVKSIGLANINYKKNLGEYRRFFDMLIMDDERQIGSGDLSFEFDNCITFDNVTFAYTKERGVVLENMNFSINKGEWVGIMGKSGVGKSTIFDLLLKFYDTYTGNIRIDNRNIKDISTYDLRKNITLVSQNMFLFPGSLRDNLLLANPDASDTEIEYVLNQVELSNFVNSLPSGINTNIGEDGLLVSGGQKQRICLAQGLLRNSKVVLLDEVTSNIDEESEFDIRDTIKKLQDLNGLTIISISHRSVFLKETNRIFIIDEGKIKKTTTYDNLNE